MQLIGNGVKSAILPGYMPGFGNDFETEALPGVLPCGAGGLAGSLVWNMVKKYPW